MENAAGNYRNKRLDDLRERLEANNFEAFVAADASEAKGLVLDKILPETGAKSVSWGGALTFTATGLYHEIKEMDGLQVIDTFEKGMPFEEVLEMRRKSQMVDLFITGTNAITESGHLVNLDMIGNRVSAITFGPKNVIILAGRNKIVADLDDAIYRIKNYAAPVNAMRLDKKTPCAKTSFCQDCSSPDRICNAWSINEKSFPKKRIKVVLINEDLGF